MQLGAEQFSYKVIQLPHISDRPDEWPDGLGFKSHDGRQAIAELGKCGKVP